MAYILGIEIKEIYIYPLGGISKFNLELNTKKYIEFFILIMGPLFQMIAYFILINIMTSEIKLISIYNYCILGFNLLPIYPLDGGKLLKLFLDRFICFKYSFKIVIYISYIVVFIIILLNKHLTINNIVMILFLILLITKEKKKLNYYYQKFILERYLNNYNFKKSKIITNLNSLYRDRKHIIRKNDKYYLEREYLEKLYKKY